MKPLPFLNNGVTQVAILVPDLDRAVENYYTYFGIGPWHFYTYARPVLSHMAYYGKPADFKMRIALSYLGDTRIELIEAVEGDTIYADFIRDHGYGPHHYGLVVENMHSAIAEAEASGLQVIMEGSGFGPDGDGHFAYLDTEEKLGVILELIERPKRRFPPEKIYPPQE
ncbi:MAG: VOC family protein [Anaerolineales bacterium]|nr:VOC family protein [Anaerolineales bacterium]